MADYIINIYGQEAWHTDAQIVASPEGLEALKEAIIDAQSYGYAEIPRSSLATPREDRDTLFASDGEGYVLKVWCLGDWDDKRWLQHKPEYLVVASGKC